MMRQGFSGRLAVFLLVLGLAALHGTNLQADGLDGLVGRWGFDDGTGRDLSGHGRAAILGGTRIHPLGESHACIEVAPGVEPLRIPASPDSPLAIARGTVCLWLNVAWEDNPTVLEYSNGAVEFRVYRRHFQPRFKGEDDFRYSSGILDYDWPKYDMREWAFYPHVRAAVGDSQWHHFAVAYDDQARKIVGWRDGERISIVDLSTVAVKPLLQAGLKEIVTGDDFVGFIDDIRIYNRVLTDADVHEIFDAAKSVYDGRSDTIATDRKSVVYEYQTGDLSLYRAWLQYRPPAKRLGEDLLNRIVAESSNATIRTAAVELAEAAKSMFDLKPAIEAAPVAGSRVVLGTPATSLWIRKRADKLELNRVEHDGFVIKSWGDGQETVLVVAANVPAGVVFGTFDLIRRIQLGQDLRRLDVLENPKISIRMVDHWSFFRGFKYDHWRKGSRDNSIYSWEELRTGDTKRIRDWARLMSSAGWNAICPSEVNWDYRDNFLEHLDEVETLARILRDHGIKLYWSPSYLLALEKDTADQLYSKVPDFGGYVLKLGSEKQNGDPRPAMVNRIADNLKPYGGYTLVRGFVYGNNRYASEEYRNLIPYDVFAPEDGKFRDNVVILPKGSPLDWDFSAPIPALDGAIQKNLSGSELVIDKDWPVSWIEKWKWWLEQDNYRKGPGTLNKFDVDCIMGVSMISPSPAWTECPLNMVNYYGLGRLSWNPDLSVDEIYAEWIRQTFGDDPEVLNTIKTILLMSDDVTRKLCLYRGYRGVWIDSGNTDDLTANKSPHMIGPQGMGIANPELRKRVLDQYAPGLRAIYGDPIRGEEFLPYFNFISLDYRLSCGRTVCQDFYANLDEAVGMAGQMTELWSRLKGKVDDRRLQYTLDSLNRFTRTAKRHRDEMVNSFEAVTGRDYEEIMGFPGDFRGHDFRGHHIYFGPELSMVSPDPDIQAAEPPVNIIFDTDMGDDCDDVGALFILHGAVERGEARLLATMGCISSDAIAPALDAINTWFGRPEIPVGTLKQPGFLVGPHYTAEIARRFPRKHASGKDYPDAVTLYRQVLEKQRDSSVVVLAVGPLRNLANLLKSPPDAASPLDGRALVAQKVKRLEVMGGTYPPFANAKEAEWNFKQDPAAAALVCSNWPTPVLFNGEGGSTCSGRRVTYEMPEHNPLTMAYRHYAGVGFAGDRLSWDSISSLVAVRGAAPYYKVVSGGTNVTDAVTGINTWKTNEHRDHSYLVLQVRKPVVEQSLEDLMVAGKGRPANLTFNTAYYAQAGLCQITSRGAADAATSAIQAFDHDDQTAWLDKAAASWIQCQYADGRKYRVTSYTVVCQDNQRLPRTIELSGSNDDGANWTVLDVQQSPGFTPESPRRQFTIVEPAKWNLYRLGVTAANESEGIRISTFELNESIHCRPNALVEAVALDQKTLTLPANSRATLNATLTPLETWDREVTWVSSDPSVAEVRRIGEQIAVVVGKKPGTCTVTATIDNAQQACAVTVTPSTLPNGWRYNELNTPPIPGAVSVAEGTFTLTGCGHAMSSWWERVRDQGVFVSQPVTGDVAISARLTSLAPNVGGPSAYKWDSRPPTTAGMMIRESLDQACGRYLLVQVEASGNLVCRWRNKTGDQDDNQKKELGKVTLPIHLKLVQTGGKLQVFASADGENWGEPRMSHTAAFREESRIGLFVCSGNTFSSTTAVFDSIRANP